MIVSWSLKETTLPSSTMHTFLPTVARIGFAPSAYTIDEDAGSVIFFIQNQNPDIQREVIVEFMTLDGTAIGICVIIYIWVYDTLYSFTDGSDYIGTTESITFQPGETLSTVQVMVIDDNVHEGIQSFIAELTTTDRAVDIFEPDATAEILDEDGENTYFEVMHTHMVFPHQKSPFSLTLCPTL